MRLSRWGWSAYESEGALREEAELLGRHIEVLPVQEDAEVVVVNSGTPVDASFLEQVPSMRLCVTNTSGHDHLSLALLKERGPG